MKKSAVKNKPLFISQDCLVEAFHFLFYPALKEGSSDLNRFAKAIVSRANKLEQNADRCRKFYEKLFKKDGIPQEVKRGDFRTLAKRIR